MKEASPAGADPVVEAYKKDIDRTLIRENLKLTVEERFRKAMDVSGLEHASGHGDRLDAMLLLDLVCDRLQAVDKEVDHGIVEAIHLAAQFLELDVGWVWHER